MNTRHPINDNLAIDMLTEHGIQFALNSDGTFSAIFYNGDSSAAPFTIPWEPAVVRCKDYHTDDDRALGLSVGRLGGFECVLLIPTGSDRDGALGHAVLIAGSHNGEMDQLQSERRLMVYQPV